MRRPVRRRAHRTPHAIHRPVGMDLKQEGRVAGRVWPEPGTEYVSPFFAPSFRIALILKIDPNNLCSIPASGREALLKGRVNRAAFTLSERNPGRKKQKTYDK